MNHLDALLGWWTAAPMTCVANLASLQLLILVVHELGHALMAAACGRPPVRYQLGWGPSVRVGRLFGCVLALGLWPVGGQVTYVLRATPPLKRALIAAGGAMATALLGLLAKGLIPWAPEPFGLLLWVVMVGAFLDSAVSLSPFWSDGRKVARHLWQAVTSASA